MTESNPVDQRAGVGAETPYGLGADGPGRIIRNARELAGLSVGDLATQIRLTLTTLNALERDDFTTLKESVYVRGYYRKCARILQLSERDLIAAYEKLAVPRAATAVPSKLLLAGSESDRRFRQLAVGRWIWGAVLLAMGLAVLLLVVRRESAKPSPPAEAAAPPVAAPAVPVTESARTPAVTDTVPAEPQPAAAAPSVAAPAALSAYSAQPLPAPASASPAVAENTAAPVENPAPPTPVAHGPAAAPAPLPADSAAGETLVLDFNKHSWAKVVDARGKTLLSGMIKDGARVSLSGKPPYAVLLGDAAGVDVSYAGKRLDTGSYVRADATARFQIPAN